MNKPTILRCYVIPHKAAYYYIAGKYYEGYNADINPLAIPRCDLDGVLAAMGVVSYSDNDGIKWLNDETDAMIRKYYSIK